MEDINWSPYWDKQRPGYDRPAHQPKQVVCLKCDYHTDEEEWEYNYNKCPACDYDDFEYA